MTWKRIKILLLVIISVFVVALIGILITVGIYSAQVATNMRQIEAYIPKLESTLSRDQAFTNIEVSPTTSHKGKICIKGEVSNEGDLDRLGLIVDSSSPPRPVDWLVTVQPD